MSLPSIDDRSVAGLLEPQEQSAGGRLAAARLADQPHRLARLSSKSRPSTPHGSDLRCSGPRLTGSACAARTRSAVPSRSQLRPDVVLEDARPALVGEVAGDQVPRRPHRPQLGPAGARLPSGRPGVGTARVKRATRRDAEQARRAARDRCQPLRTLPVPSRHRAEQPPRVGGWGEENTSPAGPYSTACPLRTSPGCRRLARTGQGSSPPDHRAHSLGDSFGSRLGWRAGAPRRLVGHHVPLFRVPRGCLGHEEARRSA